MFKVNFKPDFDKVTVQKAKPSQEIISENLEEMFRKRRSTLMIIPAVSKQVLDMARSLNGCVLAGGAALELYTGDVNKIKDWDLFFNNPRSYEAARETLVNRLGFKSVGRTDWSLTYEKSGVIVQLIIKHFPRTLGQLFRNFDFSVCCFAVRGDDIYYTKQAVEDVAAGQLNLVYVDNIITTIKRIARYGKKGYMPTTQCVKDLLEHADDIPDDGDYES